MNRAVVFGGSGFVGSAVVEALVNHGVDVCAIVRPDFCNSKEKFRLKGFRGSIVECDLRDVTRLPELLPWKQADVFYQLAWEGLSGEAMEDYALQLKNIQWTLDAVRVAGKLHCKKFVGAGTISQDELSNRQGRMRQTDRHRLFRCASQACEYMGESVAYEHGIEFFWPIISNIYGEGELNPRLITTLIRRLLSGESMKLSSGTQNYDFIYREDAGEAFYLIGEKGQPHRRYNIASGEIRPLRDYLVQVQRIVAPDISLCFGGDASFSLKKESFDITMLQKDTGFRPQTLFSEGIAKTAAWNARMEEFAKCSIDENSICTWGRNAD